MEKRRREIVVDEMDKHVHRTCDRLYKILLSAESWDINIAGNTMYVDIVSNRRDIDIAIADAINGFDKVGYHKYKDDIALVIEDTRVRDLLNCIIKADQNRF